MSASAKLERTALEAGSHVHFGLGRLAVGLVLEVIRGPRRIAVIQRMGKDKWKALQNVSNVDIVNSQGFHQSAMVVWDQKSIDPDRVTEDWLNRDGLILILTSDTPKWHRLITNADTLSAAVKDGQIELAEQLRRVDFRKDIWLFPFENEQNLGALNRSQIRVAKLIADRICSDEPELRPRGIKTEIHIACESWKEIAVFADEEARRQLFGANDEGVIVARTEAEYSFYENRKRWLINSVQAMLAIYGYSRFRIMNIPKREWGEQLFPLVLPYLLSEESELKPFVETFIDAQIIRLIQRTPTEIRTKYDWASDEDVYYGLRSYARYGLNRIRENVDHLRRIVNLHDVASVARRDWEHFSQFNAWVISQAKEEIRELRCREKPIYADVVRVSQHITAQTIMVPSQEAFTIPD